MLNSYNRGEQESLPRFTCKARLSQIANVKEILSICKSVNRIQTVLTPSLDGPEKRFLEEQERMTLEVMQKFEDTDYELVFTYQNIVEVSDVVGLNMYSSGWKPAKIKNFPQDRITDHRIKKNWHGIATILDGDLDPIIDALIAAAQQ